MSQDVFAPSEVFAFLGADRFAASGNVLNGVAVPGRDGKWKAGDLASATLAVALLQLHKAGAIALSIVETKILFIKSHSVVVDVVGDAPAEGFGASMLAAAKLKSKQNVTALFRAWLTQDVSDPWGWVLMNAFGEAEGAGYLVRADGAANKVLNFFGRIPQAEIAPGAAAEVQAGIDAVSASWQAFKHEQPDLAARLIKACGDAIGSRREANTDASSSADF